MSDKRKQEILDSIISAINSLDQELAEARIIEVYSINSRELRISVLNELLLIRGHYQHQEITWQIQELASPISVLYIRKALETNFDYLEYTCSEPEVIAKWFSWALASIGTEEAIKAIKEFRDSSNEGISKEMKYRLESIET